MWLALHIVHKAKTVDELQEAVTILEWVDGHKLPSGVLAEQVHPFTNVPMSVSPLTWSHATFVDVVQSYLEKREAVERCPACGGPCRRKIEGYERGEAKLI
jgi:GH15 family glucan-1,4-alpha-glucosidase